MTKIAMGMRIAVIRTIRRETNRLLTLRAISFTQFSNAFN
ncbi:MAG: hypothetical protein BAJALOKI1v1_230018 [Promethearchaeota archaeon]|nr:MAG: hypothetical protein BAJALOKI1v1_230018 [Candidatus Lokiarchaeota archaeon]